MNIDKATLIIKKTNNGKNIADVKFLKDGKPLPIQGFTPENTKIDGLELNGLEVDVLREKGQPVKIMYGERILFEKKKPEIRSDADKQIRSKKTWPAASGSKSLNDRDKQNLNKSDKSGESDKPDKIKAQNSTAPNEKHLETEHLDYVEQPAYAPYNFVPLNKENEVVTINAPEDDKDNKARPYGLKFNAYHENYYTGWIDIQIETKTPIFIRNTKDKSDFYSPSGKKAIPGSSLRGMIRQMVEMVSFGKFGAFNDKKTLYYRGLADRSNLRNDYQAKMSSYDRNTRSSVYKVSAGIIRKKGLSYFIIPTSFRNIPKGEARRLVNSIERKYKEFEFYNLKKAENYQDYYLVVSGDMQNKKHDWLIERDTKEYKKGIFDEKKYKIQILNNDIQNYKNDNTRKKLEKIDKDKDNANAKEKKEISSILNLINLFDKELENDGPENDGPEFEEVPCFYTLWKDKNDKDRVSFGHTAMFRLAYEKSIGDHVPDEHMPPSLTDDKNYDMAGAIFGNENDFSGRVFFEDAFLPDIEQGQEQEKNISIGEKWCKILSGPKPTTFQHYLVQTDNHIKNRKHYDSNSAIRGSKIYWHKSGDHWIETNQENIDKYPTQYKNSKIQPIDKEVKFKGRIRFENLSDIELGALLFSLELPDGCYHKIGMGKPLGLGSIKISPTLYLSDRKERYQSLLAEWDNEIAESEDKKKLISKFENYVLDDLKKSDKAYLELQSLWETKRLKELLIMLHYETGTKLEQENKIDYMELLAFKNRSILPNASQVADIKSDDNLLKTIKHNEQKKQIPGKNNIDKDSDDTKNEPQPRYIKKIEIKSLWHRYHIKWELNEDVNVLIGLNGSGKSTVLRLIKGVFTNEPFKRENSSVIPDIIKIYYDKGKPSIYKSHYKLSKSNLEKLEIKIATKKINEEIKKIDSSIEREKREEIKKLISDPIYEEVAEKIILLRSETEIEEIFEGKQSFLVEVDKRWKESQWRIKYEDDLLSTCYDEKKDLKVKDMTQKIAYGLIVTFDRHLQEEEIEKFKGGQSILDFDLEKTHTDFIKETNRHHIISTKSDKIGNIKKLLNTLFEDTGKKVFFTKSKGLSFIKDNKSIDMKELSSGEKQYIYIVLEIFLKSIENNPVILLLDEPEISLHVKWQRDFINRIRELNKNMQIIILTHSPAIIMEGWEGIETQMHNIRINN